MLTTGLTMWWRTLRFGASFAWMLASTRWCERRRLAARCLYLLHAAASLRRRNAADLARLRQTYPQWAPLFPPH